MRALGDSEALEGVFDVAGHAEGNFVRGVIDMYGNAHVLLASPVGRDCVEFTEGCHQVFDVLAPLVLHAEVVDYETECQITCLVPEDGRGTGKSVVAVLGEVGDESLPGQDARLRKSIDSLLDAHDDVAIAREGAEAIPFLDGYGNVP